MYIQDFDKRYITTNFEKTRPSGRYSAITPPHLFLYVRLNAQRATFLLDFSSCFLFSYIREIFAPQKH